MATESWSTRVRHDSDAEFRLWGSELSAKLAAVGLVQTADTGQIDWTTVTRAGISSDAGYEIWRLNDGVTPEVYFKVFYGTHASTSNPRIRIASGTGTNGTGGLTGTLSSTYNVNGSGSQTTNTARQSYMVKAPGIFAFEWKVGASSSTGCFIFCRTCDADGDPDGEGAMQHWGGGSTSGEGRNFIRYSATPSFPLGRVVSNQVNVASMAICLNVGARGETATDDGDIQVSLCWTTLPKVVPLAYILGVLSGELSPGGTFQARTVGSTLRTFLVLTNNAGPPSPLGSSNTGGMNFAILWE
jgi:hypothetical protein